jgi:hypothetical protein
MTSITRIMHLTVICAECSDSRTFRGDRMGDVMRAIEVAGWTYGLDGAPAETTFIGKCAECISDEPQEVREQWEYDRPEGKLSEAGRRAHESCD